MFANAEPWFQLHSTMMNNFSFDFENRNSTKNIAIVYGLRRSTEYIMSLFWCSDYCCSLIFNAEFGLVVFLKKTIVKDEVFLIVSTFINMFISFICSIAYTRHMQHMTIE